MMISLLSFGQSDVKVVRDIVPDLNKGNWIQLAGTHNRKVVINKQIEYALVEEDNQSRAEYFRMNDSIYYCYEYYRDDSYKSRGNFIVTSKIISADTSQCEDPENPGTFFLGITYFRQIQKTGYWQEFDSTMSFHTSWEGNYVNGIRTGLWTHCIYAYDKILQMAVVDYDKDSSKIIKGANLVLNLSSDSISKRLNGRWSKSYISCKDENAARMLYYRCQKYNGHYGDDCNGTSMVTVEYFEFLPGKKFIHHFDKSCNKEYRGSWTISRLRGETILEIKLTDKPSEKFKILYLDNQGYLIMERLV